MKLRKIVPGWVNDWIQYLKTVNRLPKTVDIAKNSKVYPSVTIGDWTYVNGNTYIFSGTIGRYCSIGYNVQIAPPNHPLDFVSTHPRFYKKENAWSEIQKPVNIGNDVWIGSNAVILQGCSIGTGAVIAAGAVVTKDVPPYEVWGGCTGSLYKEQV